MENGKLKKILIAEVAVLLALLVVAVCVRIGAAAAQNNTFQTEPGLAGDLQVMATGVNSEMSEATDTQISTESSVPEETEPEPDPEPYMGQMELSARNAFAYNLESDTLYYLEGGWTTPIFPASVTKLFSAYVALQYMDPETVVTAGDELDLVAEDSSIAYIHKGNQLTVSMLVEGMLLPSGNDAAYILAAAAAREESGNAELSAEDALAHFVDMMNETAQSLGMTGSHFCNPDGYHDEDHYTCARDLITIARLALENPIISQYACLYEDNVVYASGHTNYWHNTNSLLNPSSQYYCPDAVGLKTGSTTAAGSCLLSAFLMDGEYVIIGVFGCEEKTDRFSNTVHLYWALLDLTEELKAENGV